MLIVRDNHIRLYIDVARGENLRVVRIAIERVPQRESDRRVPAPRALTPYYSAVKVPEVELPPLSGMARQLILALEPALLSLSLNLVAESARQACGCSKRHQPVDERGVRPFAWVATVPPTATLCREIIGERGTIVFWWVFAAHQIGAAAAALGAGIIRDVFGTYTYAWSGGGAAPG